LQSINLDDILLCTCGGKIKLSVKNTSPIKDCGLTNGEKLLLTDHYHKPVDIESKIVPDSDGFDPSAENGMSLIVKTLTGKIYNIHVECSNTVEQLKRIIEYHTKISVAQQRVVFKGKQLEDHLQLWHYDIQKESELTVMLRLRGGMFHETSGRNGDFKPLKSGNIFIGVDQKVMKKLTFRDY
jgi:hypothetical protein